MSNILNIKNTQYINPEITNLYNKNSEYQQQIQKSQTYLDSDDIYLFANEITDPTQSLKNSLQTLQVIEGVYKNTRIKNFAKSKNGAYGKVKIVKFKNDPKIGRLFAMKKPFRRSYNETDFKFYSRSFENNLNISLKLQDSPYFMKVHAVVIKKLNHLNEKNQHDLKPFLILSYIEGISLRELIPNLTLHQKLHILSQLKEALLQLYDAGIYVFDLYSQNILITKDNCLKIIDYDLWIISKKIKSDSSLFLNLYSVAINIAEALSTSQIVWPIQIPGMRSSRHSLEKSLDQLIRVFRNANSRSCCIL